MGERHGHRHGHRRYPHLTREDVEVLDALPPDAARDFERFLQHQWRRAAKARRWESLESELGVDAIEIASAREAARWHRGTGGGRREPRHMPDA